MGEFTYKSEVKDQERLLREVEQCRQQDSVSVYGRDRKGTPIVWVRPALHDGGAIGIDSL